VRAVETSAELAAATAEVRAGGGRVGFVPTMGALHAGHRALLAQARQDSDVVVASIFVNPLQFGPGEDLASYPRDRDRDLAILEAEGIDLAFVPPDGEVWPGGEPAVRLTVGGTLGTTLEGAHRPGHLDGVATVVAKLLHLAGPSTAYFGQKDAQQLAMIRRMVADLAFPHQIAVVPTVREHDGLALSSRNAYLSPLERVNAGALHRGLQAGRAAWHAGRTQPAEVEGAALTLLEATPGIETQYVALVEPDDFRPATEARAGQVLATAARVGPARLIDNVILSNERED
jgi:pantoate--beta-alanine ligase